MTHQRQKFINEKEQLLDHLVSKDKELINVRDNLEKELITVKQSTQKELTLLKEETGFLTLENQLKEEISSVKSSLYAQLT